ncbi:MAG: hypothetical protein ABW215_23790 [Kibdelosporangium sp.]
MDGQAYLENLIADRLGEVRRQPAETRGAAVNLAEIQGVAKGLVAADVLRQQDADRTLTDLRKTMERAGWLTEKTSFSSTSVQFGAGRTVPGGDGSDEPELLRVISLAGRTFDTGDMTTRLVSLEVWSTMIVVRSVFPSGYEVSPAGRLKFWDLRWRWRAWDDVGTEYRSNSGGGGSGSHDLIFDSRTFEPGPPHEARTLTMLVEHPTHQAVVELPLVSGLSS